MRLVKNRRWYWNFIRQLRNLSKEGFVEQERITRKQQREYMRYHNDDYYVCVTWDGRPVGYIGSVAGDIRLAVVPWRRNSGIGKFMLKKFMALRPWAFAKVLIDNQASHRLFKSCGFEITHINDKFIYYKKKK